MFTGIVEETGALVALQRHEGGGRLRIRGELVSQDAHLGDSIAVNGVCLTVTEINGAELAFDLLAETLSRTNLGDLTPGTLVNLERALPAQGRLGGHFVQGHIDCPSEILRWEPVGADYRLDLALPPAFAAYVATKGSIAIDGISLTVAEVAEDRFTVWVIPHTLAVTNLRTRRAGDAVNLEFDLLAKYLERMLTLRAGTPS